MASAWEQAAELQTVNQRMRQAQMSMAVGEVIHARHFSVLTEEMLLRIAAPALAGDHPMGRLMPANQTGTSFRPPRIASAAAHRMRALRFRRFRLGGGVTRSATDTACTPNGMTQITASTGAADTVRDSTTQSDFAHARHLAGDARICGTSPSSANFVAADNTHFGWAVPLASSSALDSPVGGNRALDQVFSRRFSRAAGSAVQVFSRSSPVLQQMQLRAAARARQATIARATRLRRRRRRRPIGGNGDGRAVLSQPMGVLRDLSQELLVPARCRAGNGARSAHEPSVRRSAWSDPPDGPRASVADIQLISAGTYSIASGSGRSQRGAARHHGLEHVERDRSEDRQASHARRHAAAA